MPLDREYYRAMIVGWIESALVDIGLETEGIATDPTKSNLLATLPAKRSMTLLYSGHLDMVPYDPTAGRPTRWANALAIDFTGAERRTCKARLPRCSNSPAPTSWPIVARP
ncbi:hypothetical protein [Natronorubrum sp. DTA7]|uniref:hypothetical protein n=1 Tax=Natronorubrum sp. DTA7 TaxID=3447016 RepID=UPI003F85EE49